MELLALGKPIKKPPRSDERDGELFCGTPDLSLANYHIISNGETAGTHVLSGVEIDHYYLLEFYSNASGRSVSFSGAEITGIASPTGTTSISGAGEHFFLIRITSSSASYYLTGAVYRVRSMDVTTE